MAHTYDYVIVGAGSAGCVLANRLSADEGNEVLLLEAGEPDESDDIHVPTMFPHLMKSEVDWDYSTVPNRVSTAARSTGPGERHSVAPRRSTR